MRGEGLSQNMGIVPWPVVFNIINYLYQPFLYHHLDYGAMEGIKGLNGGPGGGNQSDPPLGVLAFFETRTQ